MPGLRSRFHDYIMTLNHVKISTVISQMGKLSYQDVRLHFSGPPTNEISERQGPVL